MTGDPCTQDSCGGGICNHTNTCPPNQPKKPCYGICNNPVDFSWTGSYQAGNLGTGEVCRQTTQNWVGGNCGNFSASRALFVNGARMSCSGQNWTSLPAKVNGGYCVQVTPGDYSWAYFTAW